MAVDVTAPILVLTHSQDHTVPEAVIDALHQRGIVSFRVDSDRYPEALAVSDRLGGNDNNDTSDVDDGVTLRLETPDGPKRFTAHSIGAVWRRRSWPATTSSAPGDFGTASRQQARTAFHDAVDALAVEGLPFINDPHAEARAEHKPRQLRLARTLGFTIPPTIISNDADAVLSFVAQERRRGHDVMTKLVSPLSATMDGSGPFVYSSTLTDDDIDALRVSRPPGGLQLAPQVFQRRINKTHDLRVQVMGDVVVAGAIACVGDDWRRDGHGSFAAFDLDDVDAARCRELCRRLGLVTGAVDFVVDGDGALTFLEINPAGEWGFLMRDLGVDLAAHLADCLVAAAGSPQ